MKPKPKVVFDTNVFISAILFGGNPKQCLELARINEFELQVSKPILLELSEKLQHKFLFSASDTKDVVEGIVKFAKVILPKSKVDVIAEAPKDNRILECAIDSNAAYIVSGDKKHLLSLKSFKNVQIISPKQFLDILNKTD